MPLFCAICAGWRLLLRPAAQISAVTVSASPAGCTAPHQQPCTASRYAHDNGAPSIYRTEAAERTEQNTLPKTRRNSKTPQKRPKTIKNAISRRFPDAQHAAGVGKPRFRTETATNVEPRDISMDTSSRPAPIRIAAIRPKVAKVADSRKVDSRRIVGKSLYSR